MQTLVSKLRYIYLPFLIIALGFLLVYTFLDWALFIKLDLFPINQDILVLWLPLILVWLPVLKWLRPRIKLLKLPDDEKWPDLYPLIAALAMAAPTMIMQDYLHKSCGEMVALDNVYKIATHNDAQFYTLRDFYLDKHNSGYHLALRTTGKANQYLNMQLYFAIPIWARQADVYKKSCPAWLGLSYTNQISSRLSDDEKERLLQEFLKKSEIDFNEKYLSQFVYLTRAGHTTDADMMLAAAKTSPKYNGANTTILLSVNEPFEQRGAGRLRWSLISFGIGAIVWLLMLIPVKIHRSAGDLIRTGDHMKRDAAENREIRSLLIPRAGFFVTPILIYINLLVYIAMVLCGLGVVSFTASDLLKWGANFRPDVMQGEWWRLLTSMFLHGGLMHIFTNMYSLLLVGMILEPLLRGVKFLSAYLLCGVVASCASIWWHAETVSVGASGAIFGMFGVLLALLVTKTVVQTFGKAMLTNIAVVVGLNLLLGLLIPGIDNVAHIGGLLTGIVIGLIISFSMRLRHSEK